MYLDLWSTHAKVLPNRQRAWSARTACLFSQDLLKGTRGRLVCRNVAWLHLAWVGVCAITPPTPRRGCARTYARHSDYVGWHGEAMHGNILYVGDGHVQCFDFTWWKGVLASPPTMIGSSRTLSYAHMIFHHILKIKFKINISNTFWIVLQVTFSDLCLCTQLATSISP